MLWLSVFILQQLGSLGATAEVAFLINIKGVRFRLSLGKRDDIIQEASDPHFQMDLKRFTATSAKDILGAAAPPLMTSLESPKSAYLST